MDISKERTSGASQQQDYVALDFANTLEWRSSAKPLEGLKSYDDLVSWSQKVGLIDESTAKRLVQEASARRGEADGVLRRSLALREAIYSIFFAVVHGRMPRKPDLETLNDVLPEALSRLRVASDGMRFAFDWAGTDSTLDRVLWPIAKSAAELLVSQDLGRVRECANEEEGCRWLFMDTTKNHSRRWCAMDSCGNRAKARRYYRRAKTVSN